jgi:3-phosphoshikimate 1-carboxyvinyltransferase
MGSRAVVAPRPGRRMSGSLRVPSDKSITQRALLIGALAEGITRVVHPLDAGDTRAVRRALVRLGVGFVERVAGKPGDERIELEVRPPRQLALRGAGPLDLENSGTGARLLFGLLAGRGLAATLTGDASLRGRPMGRVVAPLTAMGARFEGEDPDRLPLRVSATPPLKPFVGALPVASAQVKSAVLLAALGAEGTTRLTEPAPTRAHTEAMLRAFGVTVESKDREVTLRGPQRPRATKVDVPADPSAAAFHATAAALLPGSAVELTGLALSPRRARFFDVLARMGAQVERRDVAERGGEPVGTLRVEGGELVATEVDAAEAPDLVDELPLVAVAGALARGTTRVRGAAELRVKESDRLAAIGDGFSRMGVRIVLHPDGFDVTGVPALRGASVRSFADHRIAMALAVAALRAEGATAIDDFGCVAISYPGFAADLARLLGEDPFA